MNDYPEANPRHYRFMLEGLQELAATLAERRIKLVVRRGTAGDVVSALGGERAQRAIHQASMG